MFGGGMYGLLASLYVTVFFAGLVFIHHEIRDQDEDPVTGGDEMLKLLWRKMQYYWYRFENWHVGIIAQWYRHPILGPLCPGWLELLQDWDEEPQSFFDTIFKLN